MAKRYFNWKLAIVLVISIVVLGATAYALRQLQRGRRAEHGLEAGLEAYSQRQWQEAASQLGRYLAVNQDDTAVLLKYADAQLNIRPHKSNNIQQAIAAYRNILRIDKRNTEAVMKLTEIYLGFGMPGEAELIARRQLEENTTSQEDSEGSPNGQPQAETKTYKDPELRRMLALALVRQRKFNEAAEELKSIIEKHPEQVLAYETIGRFAEQQVESFQEPAEHWFNQAVRNNPSSALAYVIRAGYYLRNEDKAKAFADLEHAEKLDLSDSTVRLRLAQEFINAGVLDKAEEQLSAVHKISPEDQNLWQIWAQLALRSQSKEKMLNVADNGLKELSSQPWDFLPIAVELFIRAGQLERATDCISKLRQKDISPEMVAFFEGLVAEQKGQYFEAAKCWRRSIELGNQSPQARLALASVLARIGNRQSAAQQLRALVSERPNFLEGRLALIRLLAQTGNWAEVVDHATTVMQLSPENTEAVLAYLQARISLVAAGSNRSGKENTQIWQDIEKQLATLEKNTEVAVEVKLLQFQAALQQSNFTKAEELVKDLKINHPSQVRATLAEADLFTAQEKENEAIAILNKTIENFPNAVEPVIYLATLLARQGAHKESETIIKNALARIEQPTVQRDLSLLLADIYTQWGEGDNAYKLLYELAQELPSDIPIKRRLLSCEQALKNPEQSQQIINDIKLLEGDKGWQWRYEQARVWFIKDDFKNHYPQIILLLKENILDNQDDQASRMLLAAAYERGGDLKLAISTYRDALNRSPSDIRVIIPAVAALYKARQYDEAEDILNQASRRNLYHPDLQKLQLQSYLRRGELSSASNVLGDLLKNDPNNQAIYLSLASLKMQQGEFDEASELLDKLKGQDPNSTAVVYAQIQLNTRQNKPKEAIKLCDELVEKLNNVSAYIIRARTYSTLGQNDKAMEDLERAVSAEPNNIGVWLTKSDFHSSTGQVNDAISSIEQALSLDPNNLLVRKRAVSLFLASTNPDRTRRGRNILDQSLQSNPEDVDLRLFKARSALAEGTAPGIEEAQKILEKITQDQPKISEAWALIGEILLRQGQPGRALDTAMRGLVHSPNDRALMLLRARAEAARSPALAIPTLRLLREQDPNNIGIIMLLANTYIAAGEPKKAVVLLENESPKWKDPIQQKRADIALAVALYRSGSKENAQKKFDALFESEPNDPAPLLAQISLLKSDKLWDKLKEQIVNWCRKHTDDNNIPVMVANDLAGTEDSQARQIAEEILRMILERAPKNLPAMNTLATLLQITERAEESARLYQEILQLQPDNVIVMNNLAWIMCEEQGKCKEALKIAQQGLQLAPNYIDLIDTRGVIYYRLAEFDKAIESFNTAIKLYTKENPAAVASRFHLGRSLAAQDKKDKAVIELQQALELHNQIGGLSKIDLAEAQNLLKTLQSNK